MEIESIYKLVTGKLETWLNTTIEMLPNLAVALLVVIVFYALAKVIKNFVGKVLSKVTKNKTVTGLAQTIMAVLVIGIGVFFALSILNLSGVVTSLLAGAGIIGLALGFAFQDIASNFISGILLSVRHPFGIGDIIDTNDHFGTVMKLNLRNTVIRTPQGQIIYVPNKVVYENPFKNYTKNGERRIDLSCGVSYGDDLEKAKKIAIEAVEGLESRDTSKDVELYYNEFGDSSINFTLRFWISFQELPQYWGAQSEAIMALKKAFDENDIMIPFPIRTLDFGIRGGEQLSASMISNGNKTPKNAD
ncbi:MAG: mechanosensitive ion channel protein MscS [Balneola sp.]|jgi:small-conductance mechanosensitive channel|nr:mechanosensitive ion channel protein MscS [Balneola sp.]MBE78298.1 mechanosensitive ion channel protein MscS [Balneola sp.]|tara:strand:- start:79 stop:990 length:912 start_codon:yes stop_codon:yes gene_type:complete